MKAEFTHVAKQQKNRLWIGAALVLPFAFIGCDSIEMADQPPSSATVQPTDIADGSLGSDVERQQDAEPQQDALAISPPTVADTQSPPTVGDSSSSLTVGDSAPPLFLAKYLKGEPVDLSQSDRVHVVEFWATWCGPCRVGMPHISELQQHHGDDVAFIGVTREDEATVQSFLESEGPDGELWNQVIKYRIALDQDDRTNENYMRAAGQNGIPCAFIVGHEGIVEWIGHPARIDDPLQQVIDGTWDREAAAKEFLISQRVGQLTTSMRTWLRSGQWDNALEAIDGLESETGPVASVAMMKLSILEQAGRQQEASEVRTQVVDLAWDDANVLNAVSWSIASRGNKDALDLALKAADRANELTKQGNPAILDTLARVHYELGDLDEAIKWQKQAAQANNGQIGQIDQVLQKYLKEQQQQNPPADKASADEAPDAVEQ